MHISIKNIEIVTFSNSENTIFEQKLQEIASVQYLLGCGKPRHMTTTCSRMEIIQNRPLHELYNVETQNQHHDDKECHQQYCIAEIGIKFSVDLIMKALGEMFGYRYI